MKTDLQDAGKRNSVNFFLKISPICETMLMICEPEHEVPSHAVLSPKMGSLDTYLGDLVYVF